MQTYQFNPLQTCSHIVEMISWLRYQGANGQHEFTKGYISMYAPWMDSEITVEGAALHGIEIEEPIEHRLVQVQNPYCRSKLIRNNAHYRWISIPTDMCLSFTHVMQHGKSNVSCRRISGDEWRIDIQIAAGEGIPVPLYRVWKHLRPFPV